MNGGVASSHRKEEMEISSHKPSSQTHCFRVFDAAQMIYRIVFIVGLQGAS